MSVRRSVVLTACALGLVLMIGVVQAGAQGSTQVFKFQDSTGTFSGVGFDASNPNAIPPVGAQVVITTVLSNIGSQFGKPSGAKVGRALLDCSVLVVNTATQTIDGVCNGIAHVPNGFLTFGGNGAFTNAKVNYYDITGGDGPYANDRGQIKVVNNKSGGSVATITVSS